MTVVDQLDRSIQIKETPKRIVSLVPSQTELLYDLGLESSIVGITKFCVHPAHFKKEKTIVGGTKEVHFDKIKALQPDIILCNKEENTLEMIQELEKIAPVHISDIYTISDCLQLIEMYGQIFSVEDKANQIIQKIKEKQVAFKAFVNDKPKLKVAYFIWKSPWMVAAKHTFIDEMLSVNNFENYFSDLERYPEIDLKINVDVDLVLLSSEPFPFKEEHISLLKPYFPNSKIRIVDGELFSWYGSRVLKSLVYFKTLH